MEKRTLPPLRIQPVMYCNNCGEKGHVFRSCKDPVLSCGLVLVDKPTLPSPHAPNILMIRRKDSMSFAEFMRGKYDPEDTDYVGVLIQNMTAHEQASIVLETFDTLWRRMWGDDHTSSEYAMSKDKFNQLSRTELVMRFPSTYQEPEWGFPKGRRIRAETDLECAVREFGEETNIPRESYVILKNITLEETFTGLNGILYRHVYFVALLAHPEMVNLGQKFTYMQKREISGIGWKNFEDCRAYIRPHHISRSTMVDSLENIVSTYESE